MKLQNVLIVGMGVMGRQIALQCARYGYNVAMFDVDPSAIAHCQREHAELLRSWASQGIVTPSEQALIKQRITLWQHADKAAADADLLIESVPESLETKAETFARFESLCPPRALFATNTSFFTPSMLLDSVARRPLFAALHFYEPVWHARVADIMPHPETAPSTVDQLVDFAQSLQMIPIVCHTERPGYVGNAMVQAVLGAAMDVAADGVASFEDVDRAWMGIMKTTIGPFGILDRIGIDTVYDITLHWHTAAPSPSKLKRIEFLQRQMDAGRLGLKSGRGFYDYPRPIFEEPTFMQAGAERPPSPSHKDANVPGVAETVLGKYLSRVAGPVAFFAHAVVHGVIAWLILGRETVAPVFGFRSIALVALVSAALVLPTAVLVGSYVAMAVLGRVQESAAVTSGLAPSRAMLKRAFAAGAAGVAVVGSIAAVLYLLDRDATLPTAWVVVGTALATGLVGLVVQSATALRLKRTSRLDAALR